MVYKCAAINCCSDYAREKKDSNITFHSFSFNDEKFLKHWLKGIARKNFKSSKNARIFSLYFMGEDFF